MFSPTDQRGKRPSRRPKLRPLRSRGPSQARRRRRVRPDHDAMPRAKARDANIAPRFARAAMCSRVSGRGGGRHKIAIQLIRGQACLFGVRPSVFAIAGRRVPDTIATRCRFIRGQAFGFRNGWPSHARHHRDEMPRAKARKHKPSPALCAGPAMSSRFRGRGGGRHKIAVRPRT